MTLPPEAIQEFKEIYYQEFGKKLSDEKARERATSVFNFLLLLCQDDSNNGTDDRQTVDKIPLDDKI